MNMIAAAQSAALDCPLEFNICLSKDKYFVLTYLSHSPSPSPSPLGSSSCPKNIV